MFILPIMNNFNVFIMNNSIRYSPIITVYDEISNVLIKSFFLSNIVNYYIDILEL